MNDVFLNPVHPLPAVRVKSSSPSGPSASTKPGRPSSIKKQQPPTPLNAAFDSISRAIKGANSLVLSLRDGLSELERENRRKKEERRLVLSIHMKNVRLPLVQSHMLYQPQTGQLTNCLHVGGKQETMAGSRRRARHPRGKRPLETRPIFGRLQPSPDRSTTEGTQRCTNELRHSCHDAPRSNRPMQRPRWHGERRSI